MSSVLQHPSHSTRRRRLRAGTLLSAGVVAVLVASLAGTATAAPTAATTTSDDPTVITDWNEIAATTLAGDTTRGVDAVLYMGFVQAAVYDAVVGVEGRYEPYSFHARARRGTSVQAAAVAAAHKVLVTYVPSAQATLDERYAASLAQIPDGKAKDRGIRFGTRAAEHLIRLRANDGRNAPIQFTQPPAPSVWRPTPPAFLPMQAPWLGFVTPLLVRSATQFAPPAPPALTSARYTRDFNEVKALGSATSTERTPAQTDTARFFSGNALVQYNAALRDQVRVRHLDIVEAARMFAAIDMSVADAAISVWHAKYVASAADAHLHSGARRPALLRLRQGGAARCRQRSDVERVPLPLRQHRLQGDRKTAHRLDPGPLLPAHPQAQEGVVTTADPCDRWS